ncbi:MAG: hypothetical protein IPG42_06695 [Betaproteobacteria bacterium]|nr:hypothetical protein [Betaproteobacteria bacterium]
MLKFRVRGAFLLEQIVKQEEFEASEEDVNSWLDTRAADAKRPREEIEKAFGLPKNREAVNRMVTRERMVEQLIEKSKIKKSIKAIPATEG